MVLHQMYCIVSDLMGKVGAFAHPTCNGNARVKISKRPCASCTAREV